MCRLAQLCSTSLIVLILLPGTALAMPVEEPSNGVPSMLEFVRARSARTWPQVPRKVLAFYYTWYGTPQRHGRWVHWGGSDPERHDIPQSTHYPAKGAYDSYDPEIIDYHIDLAQQHGVDGFICTWWGPGGYDDRALVEVLKRAEAKKFTVTIYWETAPGEGSAQVDRAVRDLLYVLNNYGSHPSFLKVDGKPVIFVYGRVMNQVPMQLWPAIISRAEQQYPGGFLLIADGYSQANARIFDGVHTYNICGWVHGNEGTGLRQLSRSSFTKSVQLAKNAGKISCVTVIPGYDDTKIRKPGLVARREDGNTYKTLWEEAIRSDPDWVLITSWNEWHEGSEIEPSWEDGDKYMELTGSYSRQFKKTPFSQVPIGNAAAGIPEAMAGALQQLYRAHPIAVLPGYDNDAVFWLAQAGVPLTPLSWQDVVSEDKFNARQFPVVLYAGFEEYRQSVQEKEDVDRSLVRYLAEGGLLIALPSGPFPFYYNENHTPVNTAHRLGLAVGSGTGNPDQAPTGWESPPAAQEFTFHFNLEQMKNLPASVPFPHDGDVRWRPITNNGLKEGDIYIPLATLSDQSGRYWGDAMAYVEHRVSAPQHGKGIYAWMRMPDLADRNQLLFDLFQLAGQKAGLADGQ